ncbi:MAG TPA: DcaP family trimeric outer membrane transporter [Gammaproteobacteria bacterium]|nr:hypothetical protein [Xanthomonadales bacterium]MCB1593300.1 hypothetical protein [Xanthomonadales bacterium]HOP22972.1 DcaP family trimeric outer membrane transporter [Gammaproteobacteria bacterium]HPI95363.1 DcaP family trimeric outer membrane transporter [Gammaproteobacteria bacterium]HPQ86597.1 DcaP family trimeric outer membrane transporter [Gammaproteobacteria bacterium]
MKIKNKLSVLAISVSMLCGVSQNALAGGDEYQKLEDKINELESMVLELKKQLAERPKEKEVIIKEVAAKPEKEMEESPEKHTYAFGGFVKTTASFSSYSDGDLASGSAGRDFYIPATIPVGGDGESTDFDFGAKESRINFKSDHVLESGDKLSTFVEMDFLLPPGGDERISNSYNPRLRHAFIKYNDWLFGQTWSTFQNVGALPESVDFLAASESTIFERQSMIRYTNGNWQFALENPETTITPYGGGGRIVSDDNSMPDLVARYNHKADWGHFTVAALVRNLEYDQVGNNESTSSYGLSLSGKVMVGEKDDLRFMLSTGSGMGRYIGLNTANGAVINDDGNLSAIDSTAGFISYRHFWNEKVRSNFIFSQINVDNNTDYTGLGVTRSARSIQANVLFSPVSKITLGLGWLYAERELESRADGELNRLIFTAKYAF